MVQIVRCKVENILGVENVEFAPNGESVTIGGANGEGKSSSIWALIMALGGKGQMPGKPVREGAESGVVEIQLDKFKVTLGVDTARKSTLKVESSDGAQYKSPQAMLDAVFGGLSFDPGVFKSMPAEKRFETLRSLVRLDLTDLKTKYDTLYEDRRDVGRRVKDLEGKISGEQTFSDVGEVGIDVAATMQKLDAAKESLESYNALRVKITETRTAANEKDAQVLTLDDAIENLKDQIENLEDQRKSKIENSLKYREYAADLEKKLNDREEKELQEYAEDLRKKILDADSVNKKIQQNTLVANLKAQLGSLNIEQAEREKKIEELRIEKINRLKAAPFPIEGLSFDGDLVTYNGITFDQLSESEQWEVSTAIAFALNPKGIVFMKNCGGLDRKSRERVRERAKQKGVQLFLEVVDDADDVQILIAEGKVSENRL